jgi:hypothetical protein
VSDEYSLLFSESPIFIRTRSVIDLFTNQGISIELVIGGLRTTPDHFLFNLWLNSSTPILLEQYDEDDPT